MKTLIAIALACIVVALVLITLGLNQPAPSSGPLTIGTLRPVSSAPALEIGKGGGTPTFDIAADGATVHLYDPSIYIISNGDQTIVITGPLEIQLERPLDVPMPIYEKGRWCY